MPDELVLIGSPNHDPIALEESEYEALVKVLQVLRGAESITGAVFDRNTTLLFHSEAVFSNVADFAHLASKTDGWFTEWASRFATRYRQGRGYPSPPHVLESLTAEIEDFQTDLAITRRTLKDYPELFERANAVTGA